MTIRSSYLYEMDKCSVGRYTPVMMCTEQSLREMLVSPYGEACGISIVDWVREGKTVRIDLMDGTVVTLADVKATVDTLTELGWNRVE